MSDKYTIENARQDTIDICKKEIESLQSQLKQKDEEIKEVIKLCLPYHDMMWASKIMGILLNCDFRESAVKAKEWLEKTRK